MKKCNMLAAVSAIGLAIFMTISLLQTVELQRLQKEMSALRKQVYEERIDIAHLYEEVRKLK